MDDVACSGLLMFDVYIYAPLLPKSRVANLVGGGQLVEDASTIRGTDDERRRYAGHARICQMNRTARTDKTATNCVVYYTRVVY